MAATAGGAGHSGSASCVFRVSSGESPLNSETVILLHPAPHPYEKHLLKREAGAAKWQSRRRLPSKSQRPSSGASESSTIDLSSSLSPAFAHPASIGQLVGVCGQLVDCLLTYRATHQLSNQHTSAYREVKSPLDNILAGQS